MASNWQETYEKLRKRKEALDRISGNDLISRTPLKSTGSTTSSKKKKEEDTWFKSGAFDDGYQLGDITKTILGTAGDAALGITKGIGNLAEGVVDLGSYAVSGLSDLVGADDLAETTKNWAKKSTVNDLVAPLEERLNKNSLLADKADNITQGLGYVGGILLTGGLGASAGLGTVGTTVLTTGLTGTSGMGSGMSEAYQGGATDKEALTYGAITGLAEAGTELIFGGLGKAVNATGLSVGMSSLDDALAKKISSKFSSQIAKNFTEYGVKAGAEGLEEVMSGFIQGVGKYYTYQTEQDGFELGQILKDEKLLDQFIAGAVTSGIAQSGLVPGMKNGSLIEANKTGRDFVTGYTQNEQAVIDAEIAARTEGKELTNKQKSKIEAEVKEDFEKGYISTDTIESTLGGDTYNELKSLRDNKANLETQIKELESKPNAEITVGEMERLHSLREQLETIDTNTLESKLQAEMGDKIKSDGYLQRSYQEKAKRSQEFTYEAAETDSDFRKGVMESTKGKLNDTTRSHETAEALVKLSEDRQMQYKFTNNAELRELGLVPEGKTANGLYVVDKDGSREILVNTDSKKYIEAVLVHETAHDFQTTSPETYTKLQDITREFAEAQNEYSRIYSEVAGMYKNVEGVDINEEVTSRLLEDYLGNKDFINSLTTKEPSIVQKIINEIKYLVKKFTAGSPEARKLVELQHNLEKTYKEAYKQTKATETTEGTKYSLDNSGRELSKGQQEYFKDSKARDDDGSLTTVYHTMTDAGTQFNEFAPVGTDNYRFGDRVVNYYTDSKDMSGSYARSDAVKADTSKLNNIEEANEWLSKQNFISGFDNTPYTRTLEEVDGRYALVSHYPDSNYTNEIYFSSLEDALKNIKEVAAKTGGLNTGLIQKYQYEGYVNLTNPYVIDAEGRNWNRVTREYSEDTYNKFKSLNEIERDYLMDLATWDDGSLFASTIRDAHRDINILNKTDIGEDVEALASAYKKLEDVDLYDLYDVAVNDFSDESMRENSNITLSTNDVVKKALKDGSYDGVIIKNVVDYGSGTSEVPANVYVTFSSEQFKNADNLNPTTDKDIRYSLSDNQGRELSEGQIEYFKDSKVRDEEGNLLTVYHGTGATFTKFEKEMIGSNFNQDTQGFFFTDDIKQAEDYANTTSYGMPRQNPGNVMETYLNITNPLIEHIDFDPISHWDENYERLIQKANKNGNDGVIIKAQKYQSMYVAFEPNQIKNVDNLNPTTDKDIRYSLSVDDYGMSHRPSTDYGDGSNFEENMPDVFEHPEWYFYGGNDIQAKRAYRESFEALKRVRNNPEGEITIYRATIGDTINEGDWITPSRTYAEWHNESNLNGEGNILELKVKAKDIRFGGDDLNEFGYFPNGTENFSLSNESDITPAPLRDKTAPQDIRLQVEEAIAPLQEEITQLKEELRNITDIDYAPATQEVVEQQSTEAFNTIEDTDMPIETEELAPVGEQVTPTDSLFDTRDYEEVGSKKINAYQYDNPEVKPYFQEAARYMLNDLRNSTKGERIIIGDASQLGDNDYYYSGTKRATTEDIAELLDGMGGKYKYTYADIEKGLNAIIKDEGAENNAISKRIEFYLDKRLREGYTDINGYEIPADTEYLDALRAKGITDYYNNLQLGETPVNDVSNTEVAPTKLKVSEAIRPAPNKDTHGYRLVRVKTDEEIQTETNEEIAKILTEEPKVENTRNKRKWAILKANVLDKGLVFEDVSLKHKNRELMGKWDYTLTSEARGQNVIGNGHYEYDPYSKTEKQVSKSLNDIRAEVDNTGLTAEFYEYIYHKHNVDRMRLEGRYEGMENKPVFGYNVTAEQSQQVVQKYESQHPEFITFAQDVYDYLDADRQVLVDSGVISQETADLWKAMYPHYVPIRRAGYAGNAINVPLDTGRTGVNAPIKKATGGNKDILPLFDTMATRTIQTQRAAAKNSFGVELKNTIGTTINSQATNIDEVIDSVDAQEELLQEGKNGQKPTFTVFEDGEKITFEITEDMYDALKPLDSSSILSKTYGLPSNISGFHRGVLTQYNPVFMLTNAIKDAQDILINSQHSAKTYAKVPEATAQLIKKGYWYQEYMNNGGEHNSYFDSVENTFKAENKGIKKVLDLPPLKQIAQMNDFVEKIPRLAEYIASREAGRSIEVSMLDAARVTTNFKAGGNLTKFLNRNGATFLNASIQGAMQQVRNIREANTNGIRGWANLATKFAVAGLPAVLLNALLWEDDEEYEELSDYVKQNYYIVAKDDDGTFIRIPKGRTVAVIQEGVRQMQNLVTGDDEADLKTFLDLFLTNLAPNNPIENNVLSPIVQVVNNKTWYGGDLVPTRLQDLPAAEQYDESTDSFSRWLGEKTNISPVKINYLLDQYTGGIGDVLLPMGTPEAKSDADTLGEQLLAPLKSKFTTNATMNNQNVTDFYDTSEKLTTNAKKSNATDEDVLRNKYINSVKAEMNELYAEKREIQNSDLPNSEKYRQVLEVQSQINELSKEALNEYKNVDIYSNYATAGDRQYRLTDDGEWQKINDKQLEKQNEVTSSLGITPNDYWSNKEEYDYAYENPSKYALANAISDYSTFRELSSELYDIKADKDENGKSISGSRKEKVFDYINNLDLDFEQRVMLAKLEYPSYDEYNYEIIEYLNNREDISYEQMVSILTELGFTVKKDGTIEWD